MMNKLGAKEIFLILIVINFLLYYMAYMLVVSPMWNKSKEYDTQITDLTAKYEEDKSVVDSKDTYISTIETLKADKQTLFDTSFPDADTEDLHAYLVSKATAESIEIQNISLNQTIETAQDEAGNKIPTGLKNNTITLTVNGAYANVIKLLTDIQNVQKTSLLTSLTLTPGGQGTNIGYTFLTVDKGEDIVDTTLDHQFGQPLGDTVLFK